MKISTTIRTLGATAIAIALPLLAAERFGAKTGAWENTVTMTISGLSIPAEELARLPAAQRAQMEQMMKSMGVGAPRTVVEKSCITEEDLDGNAFRRSLEQPGQKCDYTQVTSTAKRQEWTFQCTAQGQTVSGRMMFEAESDTQVRGTMQASMPQGKMDAKFESRWLAADCAQAGAN